MYHHRRLFTQILPNKRLLSQHSINSVKKDRAVIIEERNNIHKNVLLHAIKSREIKSLEDWKLVRKEVLGFQGFKNNPFNSNNIDAQTIGILTSMKKYDLAENYIQFLQNEKTQLNLATIGKYFNLLYEKSLDNLLSSTDKEQILLLYENVRKTWPILDPVTLENVIPALSLTDNWRNCLQLMDEIKILKKPRSNLSSVIIAAAFRNSEDNLAWKLLEDILEEGQTVEDIAYLAYLKKLTDFSSLEQLFNLLQVHNVKISQNVANTIGNLGNNLGFKAHLTKLTVGGLCLNCRQCMQNFTLTDNDFDELKSDILNNVIIGQNVFYKTTENELNRFKNFVENMRKFDVVVDGLNVAYSKGTDQSPVVFSGLVCEVVKHFVQQQKTVLVLGRTHMNKWRNSNWKYVLQSSTVFLTENLSYDDPYLLYCALNCGKNTIIVSRDLMRSHKFLLKNHKHKFLFNRWLSQCQYQLVTVTKRNKVIFQEPLPYSDVVQKSGKYWHLPCTEEKSEAGIEATNMWLCLKLL